MKYFTSHDRFHNLMRIFLGVWEKASSCFRGQNPQEGLHQEGVALVILATKNFSPLFSLIKLEKNWRAGATRH